MVDKAELQTTTNAAKSRLENAVKAFEAERGKATIEELVKLGAEVTSATKSFSHAEHELKSFALVGIYEGIKAQVLEAAKRWDVKLLLDHDIVNVRVDVPLNAETGIEPERVMVNTLGKRVIIRGTGSGGNGGRQKWQMVNDESGETMVPRAFFEAFGEEALGEVAGKVLAEPSRYGLVDYCQRAGAKLSPTWSKVAIEA